MVTYEEVTPTRYVVVADNNTLTLKVMPNKMCFQKEKLIRKTAGK